MVQPHWERLREKYHDLNYSNDRGSYKAQNMVNREFIREESEFPSVQVFEAGLEFLNQNASAENWLVQIETFDPHEPFHAPERFRDKFDTGYKGPVLDWPRYGRVDELPEECEELRANYYATVALCDDLLDQFDAENMWEDTALIVTTDHGFLLGEHDFWAKNRMNIYEEISHIPLFFHDPRHGDKDGSRCGELTQTADLAATFINLHGAAKPSEMQSQSLVPLMVGASSGRPAALYGYFGGAVNITDGHHTYHRYPPDLKTQSIYQNTLMPTHIFDFFSPEELRGAKLEPALAFTKGIPLLKIPVKPGTPMYEKYGPGAFLENETRLYDLQTDPGQEYPCDEHAVENRLVEMMAKLMTELDAPPEAFDRISLPTHRIQD